MGESYRLLLEAIQLEKDQIASAPLFANRAAARTRLGKLDQALEDAILCTRKDPKFSKGFARIGEIQVQRRSFDDAKDAYERAIRLSESPQVKSRFQLARDLVPPNPGPTRDELFFNRSRKQIPSIERGQDWIAKVEKAVDEGSLEVSAGGGVALLQETYEMVHFAVMGVREGSVLLKGRIGDFSFSSPVELAAEAILIDPAVFLTAALDSTKRPFEDNFHNLVEVAKDWEVIMLIQNFEAGQLDSLEAIRALERRSSQQGWPKALKSTIYIVSQLVVRSWNELRTPQPNFKKAVQGIASAEMFVLEALEAWRKHIVREGLKTRFENLLRLLRGRLLQFGTEASIWSLDEGTPRRFLVLEDLETDAKHLIAENSRSSWPRDLLDLKRLAYFVLPQVEAYATLGMVCRSRGHKEAELLGPGESCFEDADQAKMSARYYELAAKLLPNDHHMKPALLKLAIIQHIRAGGKTLAEILELESETIHLESFRSRFFNSVPEKYVDLCESMLNLARSFAPKVDGQTLPPPIYICARGITNDLEALRKAVEESSMMKGGEYMVMWVGKGEQNEQDELSANIAKLELGHFEDVLSHFIVE